MKRCPKVQVSRFEQHDGFDEWLGDMVKVVFWRSVLFSGPVMLAAILGWSYWWHTMTLLVVAGTVPQVILMRHSSNILNGLVGSVLSGVAVVFLRILLPTVPGSYSFAIAIQFFAPFFVGVAFVGLLTTIWRRRELATNPSHKWVLLACFALLMGFSSYGGYSAIAASAPAPSRGELLPLPGSLRLVDDEASCGATGQECARRFDVIGSAGMGETDVTAVLVKHLVERKGWPKLAGVDENCTQTNWRNVTETATACVSIVAPTRTGRGVSVVIRFNTSI